MAQGRNQNPGLGRRKTENKVPIPMIVRSEAATATWLPSPLNVPDKYTLHPNIPWSFPVFNRFIRIFLSRIPVVRLTVLLNLPTFQYPRPTSLHRIVDSVSRFRPDSCRSFTTSRSTRVMMRTAFFIRKVFLHFPGFPFW